MAGARIIGWGAALPDTVVTNADLEAHLDTSDAWITERTGIKERRVGGNTEDLAVQAGRAAIASAGIDPAEIDHLLLATTSPSRRLPASAATVQHRLGIPASASDINAACAGFVYGLVYAHGLLAIGARRILLVGSDTLNRFTDPEDRTTAILFADGAGAVLLEAVDEPGDLLGWDMGCDGAGTELLFAETDGFLKMDGREVFRKAVRATVDSCQKALDQAGLSADDVTLFVPHQANIRILEATGQRLGIPMGRTATVLQSTGNTSAGSVPLALVDAVEKDQLHQGDVVLFAGFGAGMSWASAVVRWGADT